MFFLYTSLSTNPNRQYVIGAGRRVLGALRNYVPRDDDEEINIATAVELFEELIRNAGAQS